MPSNPEVRKNKSASGSSSNANEKTSEENNNNGQPSCPTILNNNEIVLETKEQTIDRLNNQVKKLEMEVGKKGKKVDRESMETLKKNIFVGNKNKRPAFEGEKGSKVVGKNKVEEKDDQSSSAEEWHVKKLIKFKVVNNDLKVLVLWTTNETTWEPVSEIAITHQDEIDELRRALSKQVSFSSLLLFLNLE